MVKSTWKELRKLVNVNNGKNGILLFFIYFQTEYKPRYLLKTIFQVV
jgi:hypothetical protein